MLSLLAIVGSCSKNGITEESAATRKTEQVSVPAVFDNNYLSEDGTRVAIDASGKATWESGDNIGVRVASDGTSTVDILSTEDASLFTGEIASPTYTSGDKIYSIYGGTLNGSTATFTLPVSQDGSFPAARMVSSCTLTAGSSNGDISLHFKQATAMLKLSTTTKIDKIEVSAIGNEALAGSYTYNFTSDSYTCSGESTITITPTSTDVYINMPAISYSSGICLKLTNGGQTMIQSYSAVTGLEAGKSYTLGTLTFTPISVTLGDVKTSYTTNGTVAKTNDIGGSEMQFGQCAFAGISNTMVSEVGIDYNGTKVAATRNGKTFTPSAVSSLGWTSYTVRAYIKTTAGEYIYSDAKNAVITGIPYTAAPPTTSSWSTSNADNWNSCLRLNVSSAYALSPNFNIPASLNVNATVSAYAYGGSIYRNYKPNVYISGSNTGTASGSATTLSGSNNYPATASFTNVARSIALSPSTTRVCIYASGNKGSNLTVGTNGVVVKSVDIRYE